MGLFCSNPPLICNHGKIISANTGGGGGGGRGKKGRALFNMTRLCVQG